VREVDRKRGKNDGGRNRIPALLGCPSCGEREADRLAWDEAGERVTCASCGREYAPGEEARGPFAVGPETAAAMILLVRWLPRLVRRFEAGVQEMGLKITERVMEHHTDGAVVPVLRLRSPRDGWTLALKLRNALDDFLSVDRDEKPMRLDARLFEKDFAEQKLAEVVDGRLAIARAIVEARTPEAFRAKVRELAQRFDLFRMWEFENGAGTTDGQDG